MNFAEKLSSYQLVTNLIPGAVLTEALRAVGIPLVGGDNLATWGVLGYALGSVSSRLGSFFADRILRLFGASDQNSYADFVAASLLDPKIEVLVETANGYRTVIGACLLFIAIFISNEVLPIRNDSAAAYSIICLASIMVIFLYSYRKQLKFISGRVKRVRNGNP